MKKCLKSSRRAGLSYSGGGASKPVIYQKSAAFTLAEVLITLGIIGVVAALTMPAIISNTNGKQKKVQFQKTLSVLNQAVKMSKAQDDIDFSNNTYGSEFFTEHVLKKYVKEHKEIGYYNFSTSVQADMAVQLVDGGILGFQGSGFRACAKDTNKSIGEFLRSIDCGGACYSYCTGFIDVNGTRPPNKEVSCVNASDNDWISENSSCTVDFKNMGDIFPVVFYNDSIAPATNAANYVLLNDK